MKKQFFILPTLLISICLVACLGSSKSDHDEEFNVRKKQKDAIASSKFSYQQAETEFADSNLQAGKKSISKEGLAKSNHTFQLLPAQSNTADASDPGTIKKMLSKRKIYFGTYLSNDDINQAPPRPKDYLATINKYFDLYSIPAWFNHVEIAPGKFDFSGPDAIADFAVSHGAMLQMHNLVWHNSLPDWLVKGNYTPDQLRDILKNHIQVVVRHYKEKYPGKIIAWDVVNEAMSDNEDFNPLVRSSNGLRIKPSIWTVIHKPGSTDPTDYIQLAFQWAHEADSTVKLFWNEYNTEYKGFKMDRWFSIVKDLKSKGMPIDGVGFQSHLSLAYNHPYTELVENMDRFANIGLQSQITEIDVVMSATSPLHPPYHPTKLASLSEADYAKQAAIYRGFLHACITAKNCNAYITFETWDPSNWANVRWKSEKGEFEGPFYPGIFDDKMAPKEACKALVDEAKTIK